MARWTLLLFSLRDHALVRTFRLNVFNMPYASSKLTEPSMAAQKQCCGCSAVGRKSEAVWHIGAIAIFPAMRLPRASDTDSLLVIGTSRQSLQQFSGDGARKPFAGLFTPMPSAG